MLNILISVIIPTKNGEDTIASCLNSLRRQTLYHSTEIIVIDSGSTDKTLTILKDFPEVRVVEISPTNFNHGETRNFGVSLAMGEFIVMTVQDAYAVNEFWLGDMVKHFFDPAVIGVSGQQIVPNELDKNPHEWFRPYSKPKPLYIQLSKEHIKNGYPSKDLYNLCKWDNVNAMYRKTALLKLPFKRVSFGEDMTWAKEAVLGGNKIVYDTTSQVYHYHHATYDYTYKRTLTVLYFIYKNFGYIRPIKYKCIDYIKIVYRNFKYKVDWHWVPFNWKKMNATNKAYRDLTFYLNKGEEALDCFHESICGLPPQGKQNI